MLYFFIGWWVFGCALVAVWVLLFGRYRHLAEMVPSSTQASIIDVVVAAALLLFWGLIWPLFVLLKLITGGE